jgi:hypothetical protein
VRGGEREHAIQQRSSAAGFVCERLRHLRYNRAHSAPPVDGRCRFRWTSQNSRSRTISMAENKTKFTGASVEDYIAARGNEQQRADCRELIALLKKVTRQPPRMWGPTIVGFGSYRYTYDSGHSGEAPLAGFAIRGRELVIYVLAEEDEQKSLLARLGPHKMGKTCLYFKRLADLDRSVLQKLIVASIDQVKRRFG